MTELYCFYCNGVIEDKKRDSRRADGKRYHLKPCLRELRKKVKKLKEKGKLKEGKENTITIDS